MSAAQPLIFETISACDILSVLVKELYKSLSGDSAKLKEDQSIFTIADGLVQGLLKSVVFGGDKFKAIVGEEDSSAIVVSQRPFKVDNLVVPERFFDLIDSTRTQLEAIAARISSTDYKELTIFIDPIDGTKEFYTKLGEQCTICIGFSLHGLPWAGVVYRPVPATTSWAAGCAKQNLRLSKLVIESEPRKGLLTTNGAISPFLESLMSELKYDRVPSGGCGNKVLMLLERKGACYIQDRGVSRWDTCAAQAVLEAHGGVLSKLSTFMSSQQLSSYRYDQSTHNLDFEPGLAQLTKYNEATPSSDKAPRTAHTIEQVKNYANLCGLLALAREALEPQQGFESTTTAWHTMLSRAAAKNKPQYD